MIRTFDLLNSEGQAYTLTISHRYTGFLTTAEGLGFENSPEYVRIGNSYERLTDNLNQGVISGIVQFFNPYAYQKFSAFAEFCQDKNLTLFYRTPTGLFKKDGAVTKIEKSVGDDSLKVKIEFTATSLWYQEIEVDVEGSELTIVSDSTIESPCILSLITYWSGVTGISWTQTVNGTTVVNGSLSDISLTAGRGVVIRTDTNPYKIYMIPGEYSLYNKSNFGTKRFPFLQKGTNTFTFSITPAPPAPEPPDPAPLIGRMNLKAFINYETI